MTAARYDPEVHGDYLDEEECAAAMELSVAEVRDLVKRRVLKSINLGFGRLIQPAIVNI